MRSGVQRAFQKAVVSDGRLWVSDQSRGRRLAGSFTAGVSHRNNRRHRYSRFAWKRQARCAEGTLQAQRDLRQSPTTTARAAARTRAVQLSHRQQTSSMRSRKTGGAGCLPWSDRGVRRYQRGHVNTHRCGGRHTEDDVRLPSLSRRRWGCAYRR
jgi:hypothetical protein